MTAHVPAFGFPRFRRSQDRFWPGNGFVNSRVVERMGTAA